MKRIAPTRKIRQLKDKHIPIIRQRLLDQQKGICPICKKPVHRACLDHEHTKRIHGSGRVRGVLCADCNIFIAKSENNCIRYGFTIKELPTILRNMANYLEKPHTIYMHPSERPSKPKLMKRSYTKLCTALRKMGYTKKIPPFRVHKTKPTKPVQELTKPLRKLYKLAGILPEFY